jgi:hypothetical protein
LAFKYKVKSADQAICHDAFHDGLTFLQAANTIAVSKAEFKVLLAVISAALDDLNLQLVPGTNSEWIEQLVPTYKQLKVHVEESLVKLKNSASFTKSKPVPKTNILDHVNPLVKRESSGQLNWQPSYVSKKYMNSSPSTLIGAEIESSDKSKTITSGDLCHCIIC